MQSTSAYTLLVGLQQQLKKEYLLVEKEQQEKTKIKIEIEQSLRSYYLSLIEHLHPRNSLRRNDGFDNCYNFIKDVVIYTSQNVAFGRELLKYIPASLAPLLANILYQRIETTDAYSKDVTLLATTLLKDIYSEQTQDKYHQQILHFLNLYMNHSTIFTYFERIAQTLLLKVTDNLPIRTHYKTSRSQSQEGKRRGEKGREKGRERGREKGRERGREKGREENSAVEVGESFMELILFEAIGCPLSVKLLLREVFSQTNSKGAVWLFINCFYLKPLCHINDTMRLQLKPVMNYLAKCYSFTHSITISSVPLGSNPLVEKIVDRLLTIKQERDENELQIMIFGACINYDELRILIEVIVANRASLSKINEKIVNRALKVVEMSQGLKILEVDQPEREYTILSEMRYSQLIECDYHKRYISYYKQDALKNILRQVLVEIEVIGDRRNNPTVSSIFQNLICEFQYSPDAYGTISAQILMKLKYIVHLLSQRNDQIAIVQEMIKEYTQREEASIGLYKETKFSLLKALCNIKKCRGAVSSDRTEIIKQIEELPLKLCITSANSAFKYRVAGSDEIIVSSLNDCVHKENVFLGSKCHAQCVVKCVSVFASLKEVRDIMREYNSITAHKVREAFKSVLECICRELHKRIPESKFTKEITYHVFLRTLSEELLSVVSRPCDRQLHNNIMALSVFTLLDPSVEIIELHLAKLPKDKMQKLKEVYRGNNQLTIFKSIIKSQPTNLISQLTFIELFLSEEKLLSTDGKILSLFKSVARNIIQLNVGGYYAHSAPVLAGLIEEAQMRREIDNIRTSTIY